MSDKNRIFEVVMLKNTINNIALTNEKMKINLVNILIIPF